MEIHATDVGHTIAPIVIPAVAEKKEPVKEEKKAIEEKKAAKEPVVEKKPIIVEEKKSDAVPSAAIIYKVQILVSEKKIPFSSDKLKGVEKPGEYIDNGIYKYTAGEFVTKKHAVALQTEIRKNGFKDAFVIATQDGKRIPFK